MRNISLQTIKKAWFTLVELLVALSISALVLIIIFYFVTDTVIQLAETNKNSKFLDDFARFSTRIDTHASTFPNTSVLVDTASWVWHDVVLLQDIEGTTGMLWWVVDATTYRLLPNSEYGVYKDAVIGYRLISSAELVSIIATPSLVYGYNFFGDKTFPDFKVKEFQAITYNSGSIVNIDLDIATTFEQDLVGVSWNQLPRDDLFEVNINF